MTDPESPDPPELPGRDFSRYIPGLLVVPPGEQAILDRGGGDHRKIITADEAARRLSLYDEDRQAELFARRLLGHPERALFIIKTGGRPRVESVLNANIRILDLLERGPIDPAGLSLSEIHAIAPVMNDPDMQTEAVREALASGTGG